MAAAHGARHPIWRGHLRLALVSCPVALFTTHAASEELHFHLINPDTGNRVRMLTVDAGTEKEVRRGDLVKGFEFKKDSYVLLEDADFERAKIESSATLTADKFVPAGSIDPVYYDASYYVVPDGEGGEDVYAVLRDAIDTAGRVALSRLVIARRERAVAIMPMGRGLVLHTLHDEKEVHDPDELFAGVPTAKSDPAMVKLAIQLIDRQAAKFDPADMEDRYEARLREVIEARLRGEEDEEEAPEPEDRGNVIDLMAALKRSLGDSAGKADKDGSKGKGGKRSAKAAAPAGKHAKAEKEKVRKATAAPARPAAAKPRKQAGAKR